VPFQHAESWAQTISQGWTWCVLHTAVVTKPRAEGQDLRRTQAAKFLYTMCERREMTLARQQRSCGAKTRDGVPCRQPSLPNGRCHYHGGRTPVGPALPQFKHGRYSKAFPSNLLRRFEDALSNSDQLTVREELALLTARTAQLLERLRDGVTQAGEADTWRELTSLFCVRSRLVGTEAKRIRDAHEFLTVAEAMTFGAALAAAIRRHVDSPVMLPPVLRSQPRWLFSIRSFRNAPRHPIGQSEAFWSTNPDPARFNVLLHWTKLVPAVTLSISRHLGPFEIDGPLGAHGMGEVYAPDTPIWADTLQSRFSQRPSPTTRNAWPASAAKRRCSPRSIIHTSARSTSKWLRSITVALYESERRRLDARLREIQRLMDESSPDQGKNEHDPSD